MPCQHFGHSKWVVNEVSRIFNAHVAVGKGSSYARLKRVAMESNVYIATTRKHLAVGLNTPRLSWGVKTSLPCSLSPPDPSPGSGR